MDPAPSSLNAPTATLLGALLSALTAALTITAIILFRRSRRSKGKGHSADDPMMFQAQPAVSTEMSASVPHHFTEDLIIPGFTETGQQVEEQDDTLQRSPEGV